MNEIRHMDFPTVDFLISGSVCGRGAIILRIVPMVGMVDVALQYVTSGKTIF